MSDITHLRYTAQDAIEEFEDAVLKLPPDEMAVHCWKLDRMQDRMDATAKTIETGGKELIGSVVAAFDEWQAEPRTHWKDIYFRRLESAIDSLRAEVTA